MAEDIERALHERGVVAAADEQLHEREDAVPLLPGGGVVAALDGSPDPAELIRDEVWRTDDDTVGAGEDGRKHVVVGARQNLDVVGIVVREPLHLREVAARVLHEANRRNLAGEAREEVGREVDTGRWRDVVDTDRDRGRVGDRRVVGEDFVLGDRFVEGRDREHRARTDALSVAGQCDRVARYEGAYVRHHDEPVAGLVDDDLGDAPALIHRQTRNLARRTARYEALDPAGRHSVDQRPQRRLVDRGAVRGEWRDHRRVDATKHVAH